MGKSVKRKAAGDNPPAESVKPLPSPPPVPAATISPQAGMWPADKVERRQIGELLAYAQNPMLHGDDQIAQIAASMREFGWTMPILVDEHGVIIAGHGRLRAAQLLGLTEAPVMTAVGWTPEQKRAYRIADNQLPRLAEFDTTMLRMELTDLKLAEYPLELLGFEDTKLVSFMAAVNQRDPEAASEPPAAPVSRRGDLWLLGKHRLLCGDATAKADVDRLMNGAPVPHLMATDPPYGVNYDPAWRVGLHRVDRNGVQLEQEAYGALGAITNDDRGDWRAAWVLFPGDVIYAWSPPGSRQFEHYESLVASGFEIRMQIIWRKPHFALGRGNYHVQHEVCWYAVRTGRTAHWGGARDQSTIWDITSGVGFTTQKSGPGKRTGHSTQKPLECMKRPIENNSRPGEMVYDPFLGSGTTMIAAEMAGRGCLGLEIDPAYVDVAVRRWEDYAGAHAVLDGDGRTFAAIASERGVAPPPPPKEKAPTRRSAPVA